MPLIESERFEFLVTLESYVKLRKIRIKIPKLRKMHTTHKMKIRIAYEYLKSFKDKSFGFI